MRTPVKKWKNVYEGGYGYGYGYWGIEMMMFPNGVVTDEIIGSYLGDMIRSYSAINLIYPSFLYH